MQVSDGESYGNFVVWDQDCNNLIGVLAFELRNKMIEVLLICLSITLCKFQCKGLVIFLFFLG